ncbi:MAG: FtsX-like permease family protein [Clostridia bacterium]|nr:FtsX-like permease family protein [Clostridia bacterium]
MKIVNKLTLRHLKENKKRTVITVIGIIISVAMLTATCVSVTSLAAVYARDLLYMGGEWHASLPSATAQQIETLEKNTDLKYVAAYKAMDGDLYSFNLHNDKRVSLGIGDMGAGNRDYFAAFLTGKYTGTIPKDDTEIMVYRSLLEKNGLHWNIGDKVTLDLGKRYVSDENGTYSITATNYIVGETFESTGEKTFTVVGILEENPPTRGVQILRGLSKAELDGAGVYLTANTLDNATESVLTDAVTSAGLSAKDLEFNKDLFRYNWIVRDVDEGMRVILHFAEIILVLIMIASVMLIYNAFSISLSERSRYLGMLASVGATKAQKRRSVYFEGAVLGAVGIPLGFGAGLLGMAITFKVIQPLLQKSGLNMENTLTLVFPWWILPVIAVLSIVTIAISAYIPARRASRTTPIDALRQTSDVKVKARKLKSPKIIRKIFGYEGELAYKNMKRNGKKSRVITSALVLSVVLFLSVNTFCSMFQEVNQMSGEMPYQLYVETPQTEKTRLYADLAQTDGVDAYYSALNTYFSKVRSDSKHIKAAYRDKYTKDGYVLDINVLDDADFNALCTENQLDYHTFYQKSDSELPILVMNSADHKVNAAPIFEDSVVGTALEIPEDRNGTLSFTVTVKGLIRYRNADLYAYDLSQPSVVSAFVPLSVASEKFDFSQTIVGIETKTHAETADAIQKLLENEGYEKSYVMDAVAQTEMMNSTILIMQVFIYGFISLMTLISVANIFNTVSTGIDLRRKEFAMLKSVGVTPKGFRKMLRFESLFYGLKALIYGLPLSLIISVLMWKSLTEGFTLAFHPDWRIYLGVIVAVFFITGISMAYATSKVKKDSIIETLKSEIN